MKKILFYIFILMINSLLAKDIDPTTGLIIDKGLSDIKENCTICHPGRFVVVNGGDRKFWQKKIKIMQEGYGLWDLPKEEKERMIRYLSKNYSKKVNVFVDD